MSNDNLKFCWEQYLKLIDIFITIATGSMVIISSIFISIDSKINQSNIQFLIVGFVFLFTSIISLIVWRIISHTLMEYELLKNEKNQLLITKLIQNKRAYYIFKLIFMWLSGLLTFTSWILLGLYVVKN